MSTVLAVVPCLNEVSHLANLLKQLLSDPAIALVVVADGGSTDGSRALVAELAIQENRLRLMDNPARIQSAGLNMAVREFRGRHKWLLRVDAHCQYPCGYTEKLLAAAEVTNAESIVVPMITQSAAGFQTAVAAAQNSVIGTGGSPHRHLGSGRFVNHGHHALMNIAAFVDAGGYCEAMPCNEDAELDHRLTATGVRIWLEPSAAIGYYPRSNPAALWRQYFRYGTGRARMLRRHRIRPAFRQAIPLLVPAAIALAPLSVFHWVFALPLSAWLVLMAFAGVLIGLKNRSLWAIMSGLAAAIMHLAWSLGFLREWLRFENTAQPAYGFET